MVHTLEYYSTIVHGFNVSNIFNIVHYLQTYIKYPQPIIGPVPSRLWYPKITMVLPKYCA